MEIEKIIHEMKEHFFLAAKKTIEDNKTEFKTNPLSQQFLDNLVHIMEKSINNKNMKVVKLKPSAIPTNMEVLGAKLIDQDGKEKIIVAAKEGLNRVVLSFTNEGGLFEQIIESIEEAGTPLFVQVEQLFNDLFNRLPRFIEQDSIRYELGRFAAPGKELDRVVYQAANIEETEQSKLILVEVKAPAMIRANSMMHNKLEELGYL